MDLPISCFCISKTMLWWQHKTQLSNHVRVLLQPSEDKKVVVSIGSMFHSLCTYIAGIMAQDGVHCAYIIVMCQFSLLNLSCPMWFSSFRYSQILVLDFLFIPLVSNEPCICRLQCRFIGEWGDVAFESFSSNRKNVTQSFTLGYILWPWICDQCEPLHSKSHITCTRQPNHVNAVFVLLMLKIGRTALIYATLDANVEAVRALLCDGANDAIQDEVAWLYIVLVCSIACHTVALLLVRLCFSPRVSTIKITVLTV